MKPLIIGIPAVAVVVLGLGVAGVIPIPGVTPKKAKANAARIYSQKDEPIAAKPRAKPKHAKPAAPTEKKPPPLVELQTLDPDRGAKELARVWNELKADQLVKVTASWKEEDLAKILRHMDTSQVAKMLGRLSETKADRASNLSRMLRDQGSVVPKAS